MEQHDIYIPDAINQMIESNIKLRLELGCGDRKKHPEAIGIDMLEYDGVDIVGDIHEVLLQLPENSTGDVYSYHCFEHLPNLELVIDELGRIMTSGSKLQIVVPHFSNPYYYSDPTHRQPFGLYTFCYFAKSSLFSRPLPTYKRQLNFELCKVKLIFKSPKPFYLRWLFKRLIQAIVNMNHYSLEFYEENLCWISACYEIQYELKRQ